MRGDRWARAMGGGAAAYRTVAGPTRANNGHSTGTHCTGVSNYAFLKNRTHPPIPQHELSTGTRHRTVLSVAHGIYNMPAWCVGVRGPGAAREECFLQKINK